jgi:hypothetical protein
MKTKTILILSLISVFVLMQAQNKSRYPIKPTSTWRVDSVDAMWKIVENTKYFINGDTSIESKSYFKLYKSGILLLDAPYSYKDIYVGALRDDDNKIFFVKRNKAVETMLFDFNLKAGDTIQSFIGKGKKIISVEPLQNGRKAFYYAKDHYNLSYYIEGIGSNGGLFSAGSSFVFIHSGEMASYLICYSENGELVYQSELGMMANCDIVNPDYKFPIEPSAIWRYDKEARSDNYPGYERYQYYFNHDTTIGSLKYFKLYKTGFFLDPGKDGNFVSTFENNYAGALRDKDNKYYFISSGSNTEIVLYDFNLNVGDIVESEVFKGDTVFAIDTVYDNRKRFYLNKDRYSKRVIEGIGSVNGFLEGKDEGTYLLCFSEQNVPIYHYSACLDCRLDLKNTTFPVCNSIRIIPELTSSSDDAKLVITTCYQIPSNSAEVPLLSKYSIQKNEFNFNVNLFYLNNNTAAGEVQMSYVLFDTLSLGHLMMGQYRVDCAVNTIHNEGNTDTVFNDKSFWRIFLVQSSSVRVSNVEKELSGIRIYPVPAKEKIIIDCSGKPVVINTVELFNVMGMKMFTKKTEISYTGDRIEIPVSCLKKGIYFVRVNNLNSFYTQKIIIE